MYQYYFDIWMMAENKDFTYYSLEKVFYGMVMVWWLIEDFRNILRNMMSIFGLNFFDPRRARLWFSYSKPHNVLTQGALRYLP